jgi:hypothetical protein
MMGAFLIVFSGSVFGRLPPAANLNGRDMQPVYDRVIEQAADVLNAWPLVDLSDIEACEERLRRANWRQIAIDEFIRPAIALARSSRVGGPR